MIKDKTNNSRLINITSLDWKVKVLLVLSFLIIMFSFLAPFLFTRLAINEKLDFSGTGTIGDTIGGIMNPFIAISGVIVTGLAFYIQFKANLLQRELFIQEQEENNKQLQEQIDNQNKQFQLQKIESQFYEMLKLHRENVTEMEIIGYDFKTETNKGYIEIEKVTRGRKVFVTMKTEFECILEFYKKYMGEIDVNGFHKCYKLFFSGLDNYKKKYPNDNKLISELEKARVKHGQDYHGSDRKNYEDIKLYFNYKPFSGHSSRLGHYFRHLFLIVKSIVNNESISNYHEKMKYLRILRAQLSNHEQILMFYNWLSEYGNEWENDNNSFFTEYKMIHNLWYNNLFNCSLINEKVNYLRNKDTKLREGNMYEID